MQIVSQRGFRRQLFFDGIVNGQKPRWTQHSFASWLCVWLVGLQMCVLLCVRLSNGTDERLNKLMN